MSIIDRFKLAIKQGRQRERELHPKYCHACGGELLTLIEAYTIFPKYGKKPIVLCHKCKWDYSDYCKLGEKIQVFKIINED